MELLEQIGETHQGIFDLSFFKIVPNITIMAPKDFKELEDMMDFAVEIKSPIVIRYPRGGESKEKFEIHNTIELGKCEVLKEGKDITIITIGNQVSKGIELSNDLAKEEINADVINVRFLKPFDKEKILEYILKTKFVVTLEDNTLVGGLGSEIKDLIIEKEIKDVKIKCYGYPDVFVEHGSPSELEKLYNLDEKTILNDILKEKNK